MKDQSPWFTAGLNVYFVCIDLTDYWLLFLTSEAFSVCLNPAGGWLTMWPGSGSGRLLISNLSPKAGGFKLDNKWQLTSPSFHFLFPMLMLMLVSLLFLRSPTRALNHRVKYSKTITLNTLQYLWNWKLTGLQVFSGIQQHKHASLFKYQAGTNWKKAIKYNNSNLKVCSQGRKHLYHNFTIECFTIFMPVNQ